MDYTRTSTKELLAVLIGKRLASRVYKGQLGPLFAPSDGAQEFEKLLVSRELVRRWMEEKLRHEPTIRSPQDTQDYLKVHFSGAEQEIFACLFLDNRHRLIAAENLFHGTIDNTTVYPREVVKRALRLNAAAVILSHNHPSGVAEPSDADRLITRRIRDSLELVDVRLLDHFVVGAGTAVSLASRGLL
jgi:DNA repair protein RadC